MTAQIAETTPIADRRTATRIPTVIQGGMGVAVSSWHLAHTVSSHGGLGVVSGVGPDLVLSRTLQDGDPGGHVRRALDDYPDQDYVATVLKRFYREGGLPPGTPYRPIPKLDLNQKIDAVRLAALGCYFQVWLAKEGHDGVVGVNLLEKVQLWTPAALLGAMIAGVDAVLVGAGVPAHIPRVLDGLAKGLPVSIPIDVSGALSGERHSVTLDPQVVMPNLPSLHRPEFLAIVSSHILAAYLNRDPGTAPDGFVVEGPPAGGHNAPPRRPEFSDDGELQYGERDIVDLNKMNALGLPYWLAGGYATHDQVQAALAAGANGVQIGTVFALCTDSGLLPGLRESMVRSLADGSLNVRTDHRASPTGFPFKVVQQEGTIAMPEIEIKRERICDLSYLRTPYRREDGSVGYRCASEPFDAYVKKGGKLEDTEGRKCLCNGLLASAGQPQLRPNGDVEPPLLTLGQDLEGAKMLLALHPNGWSALDVLEFLTPGAARTPAP